MGFFENLLVRFFRKELAMYYEARSITFYRRGKYLEAIKLLKKSLRLLDVPNNSITHLHLGINYLKLGEHQNAIDNFAKSYDLFHKEDHPKNKHAADMYRMLMKYYSVLLIEIGDEEKSKKISEDAEEYYKQCNV